MEGNQVAIGAELVPEIKDEGSEKKRKSEHLSTQELGSSDKSPRRSTHHKSKSPTELEEAAAMVHLCLALTFPTAVTIASLTETVMIAEPRIERARVLLWRANQAPMRHRLSKSPDEKEASEMLMPGTKNGAIGRPPRLP